MAKNIGPQVFRQLASEGYIEAADIRNTPDGFCLVYKSLADILKQKNILDFPDSKEESFPAVSFLTIGFCMPFRRNMAIPTVF